MALRAPETSSRIDFEEVLANLASAVMLTDPDGQVSFVNERAVRLLGCGAMANMPIRALLAACGVSGSVRLSPNDEEIWGGQLLLDDGRVIRIASRPRRGGGTSVVLGDITNLLAGDDRAQIDRLTELPDRGALRLALGAQLAGGGIPTVFLIALDRFKRVNDTLGHPVGDVMLRTVARRITALAGGDDIVARFGGDEFVLASPKLVDPIEAHAFAERVIDFVTQTNLVSGNALSVGVSVGIASGGGTDRVSADGLLKRASLALASAKSAGGGCVHTFVDEMDARMQARHAMEVDLTCAMSRNEFALVYQPQFELQGHELELVGFEALLRWHSASRGTVSPAEFIPIAEDTGLIDSIGEWVLRTACRDAASWTKPVTVAVNLSPRQIHKSGLLRLVTTALAAAGLSPNRLELEITEGALLADTDEVVSTLRSLHELGVRFSMDDFGTGFSSLSYLQKFPFDKLKIDQSFVRGMLCNEEAAAIVRTIARLGLSLGMVTTAEGVETEEQLAAVLAEGCTEVQGFLTGKPMACEEAAILIIARAGVAAANHRAF